MAMAIHDAFIRAVVAMHNTLAPQIPLAPGESRALAYTSMQLAGEAGELANVVKKMWRGDGAGMTIKPDNPWSSSVEKGSWT